MFSMKSFLARFFGASSQLSVLEKAILESVKNELDDQSLVDLWDRQVKSINKIQRLPEGVEVDFYRMIDGKPGFDPKMAFPVQAEELKIARLEVKLPDTDLVLIANVWCVKGILFSIEYKGAASYFEEVAALGSSGNLKISCQLLVDLSSFK